MNRALLALIVSAMAAFSGCRCNNDKPYVPYSIDSAPTAKTSSAPPLPTPSAPVLRPIDGGTFARVPAQVAPPGTSSWNLGGMALTAPPGRFFLVGLPVGTEAAVAFVGDGGSLAGEVVIYRSAAGRVIGPTTLARLPDWLPVGQDCTHMPTLSQVGPSSVWLDVASVCKSGVKGPNRYLALLSVKAEGSGVKADFRVSDPAPGERLAFDADGSDRDNDGTDDLLVQLSLEGAPTPLAATTRATAALKYLARPAGMSRDMQEPAQSLRSQAAWYGGQAAKREAAEGALSQARQGRRLVTLLCAEAGAPVVMQGDGAPIACSEVASLDELRFAEGRAFTTLGNLPAAFAVAGQLRDAKNKPRRAADLDAALEAAAKPRKVQARPLRVMPTANRVALPMAFDAAGALLVLADDNSVVRVDPQTGDEAPAPNAARWNPLAELVGDMKVHASGDDCKAGFQWIQIRSGAGPRNLPSAIPGSAGATCTPNAEQPLFLLDRNADGLTALLQGEPYAVVKEGDQVRPTAWPTGPGGQGTARSPDGRWTALASSDRALVRGPDRSEIWKPSTRFTLTSCTASNDAKAVACLLERGIVLLTP